VEVATAGPLPPVVVARARIVMALFAHVKEKYVELAPRLADRAKVAQNGALEELVAIEHMRVAGAGGGRTKRESRCIYSSTMVGLSRCKGYRLRFRRFYSCLDIVFGRSIPTGSSLEWWRCMSIPMDK